MIDAREVAKKLKLTPQDETEVRRLGEQVTEVLKRPDYDGRPFNVQIPVGEGEEQHARTYRIACALQRRFQAAWWLTNLETTQDAFGQPEAHVLWLAIDPAGLRTQDSPGHPQKAEQIEARFSLRSLHDELSEMFGGGSTDASGSLPKKVDLSVLLGTYNRLPFLKDAVKSIRQAVGDLAYEIVVVDGGSTDGSRAWLAAQPDVLFLGERRLEGAVRAFNQAFSLCRGEFVANANDDIGYEGLALAKSVEKLRECPEIGQVAFALRGEGEDFVVNSVHEGVPGTIYANHGVVRKSIADKIAYITGGFWPPCYETYAGDCEFSAWVWRLGYEVRAMLHLRVFDSRPEDGLREKNRGRFGADTKRMYARWPAAAFRPDGPMPRVTEGEVERYLKARDLAGAQQVLDAVPKMTKDDALGIFVELVEFPEPHEERRVREIGQRVRAFDPVEGRFPKRAEALGKERVLHVHINGKDAVDQQEGLVRALREWGSGGYEMVRWTDLPYAERQIAIVAAAARLKPTVVFMQLQMPDVVDRDTIRNIREVSPEAVIVTWNGDIANVNSPFDVEWQVQTGRLVDLTLHSSMTHVRVLRAAGVHSAGYLQIGYDEQRYKPPAKCSKPDCPKSCLPSTCLYALADFDVSFLGSRYGQGDVFSSAYTWKNGNPAHDAALRDEVVEKMREVFGVRFGLFGSGWPDARVIPVTESHEVYQCSKIGLSVSLDNNLECYSSDRIFRILGCGALLLVKRFPGMSVLGLEEGENCLVFDTAEEAVLLARGALIDIDANIIGERSRDQIAVAGAKLARDNHTWSVRMREMQVYVDAVRAAREVK